MRLPKPSSRRWHEKSQPVFLGMAVIVWGLKLAGIIDEMAAFGMMIFVGGAVIAHHIDSVQDDVDRLMELERQRQDNWGGE